MKHNFHRYSKYRRVSFWVRDCLRDAEKRFASTYYQVSGGPVRMTCHSNGFESSTRPAEKPESVFLLSSVGVSEIHGVQRNWGERPFRDKNQRKTLAWEWDMVSFSEFGLGLPGLKSSPGQQWFVVST